VGIKKFKPTTPWRRGMTWLTFEEITTSKPYKPLTMTLKKHAGRNSSWRLTVRHKGGGHAKKYRIIDFFFTDKKGIEAKVKTIEYDPYRTAWIALIAYKDWEKRYILAHKDMKVWDTVITDEKTSLDAGNRMLVSNIPVWFQVYNVELVLWQWASSVRSAWSFATIVSQDWEYTQIKLPSWEIRLVHKKCYATIGQVSNTDHNQVVLWKAWRSRWMWIRPTVRGKAMNPVDHPHGGWEWRSPIWMKAPKTPWWKLALWVKTRSKKKTTNRWILRKRDGKLMK
jgi:large subunit ribosomal protein L2